MAPLVSLAGKPLYGVDSRGVEWTVTRVSGWNDGADVRADVEVRPGRTARSRWTRCTGRGP
jgi:hypothetical protein